MIIETLKNRFESNMLRHAGFRWAEVESRLLANSEALAALEWMDETGGEPDVTGRNGEKFVFADCSAESPSGRRSLCYDDAALKARKKNPPAGCADDQAQKHGIVPSSSDARRVRPQDIELDFNAGIDPFSRRRAVLREAVRNGVRFP